MSPYDAQHDIKQNYLKLKKNMLGNYEHGPVSIKKLYG